MPDEHDKVFIINEIQVAMDADIEPYTDDLILDYDHASNGLVLLGNESNCC